VPVATSVGGLIFGLVLIGALLSAAMICAMKGKWVFFVVGWFNGIFWIIGASRLAKPNSRWAKRRYGDLESNRGRGA
jgi:Mn2+/Fe2+ NRAMP family transporter